MNKTIITAACIAFSASVFAQYNKYEIKTDPYGSSSSGSTDIEMRKKYDYDPSNKFRGEMDTDGTVRMRNSNGDRLRGEIDSDGYGKLRDQNGNTYRVKPQ